MSVSTPSIDPPRAERKQNSWSASGSSAPQGDAEDDAPDEYPQYLLKVLERFPDAVEKASGWDAHCPCPDHGNDGVDRHPSLHISVGEGGRVLINCRAGCDTQKVIDKVGLTWGDLDCPPGEEPAEQLTSSPGSRGENLGGQDLQLRDRVYRGVLKRLSLTKSDRRSLMKDRGLDERQCELRDYRTMGLVESRSIPQRLYEEFEDDLYRVPGFALNQNKGQAALNHGEMLVGVVVPVRDPSGRVIGLKTRRRGDVTPRYMAWSTPSNVSCGALVHCPWGRPDDLKVVRVTEGEFKADVAAALTGTYTISSPGVNNWERTLPVLRKLGPKRVLLAFDWRDVLHKQGVAQQLQQFHATLVAEGYTVGVETWDEKYKGIDDALHGGAEVKQHWGEEVDRIMGCQSANLRTENEGWKEPKPIEGMGCSAIFPVEVFPSSLQDYIHEQVESVGCPVSYLGASMLTVAGSAMGAPWGIVLKGKAERGKGYVERANLFMMLLGPVSSAKSPAMNAACEPLKAIEMEAYEPEGKQLWCDDATTEALGEVLSQNARGLLLHRDELTQLTAAMNAYRNGKGGDRQFYLRAWGRDSVRVNRVSKDRKKICVPRPYLSILGGVTPDQVSRLTDKESTGDGFLQRWLAAVEEEAVAPDWSDSFPSDAALGVWESAIRGFLEIEASVDVYMTSSAKDVFISHFNDMSKDVCGKRVSSILHGTWKKYQAYFSRLVLILHALECATAGGDKICVTHNAQVATVERAWTLLNYFKKTASYMLERSAASPHVQRQWKIIEVVRNRGLREFTKRQLNECVKGNGLFQEEGKGKANLLDAPLESLVAAGWLREIPSNQKAGEESRRFLTNPNAFPPGSQFADSQM